MIKVIAEDFIKEEYLDLVKPLYAELVVKTKLEKDCIEYNLYIDQDDKTLLSSLKNSRNTKHYTGTVKRNISDDLFL